MKIIIFIILLSIIFIIIGIILFLIFKENTKIIGTPVSTKPEDIYWENMNDVLKQYEWQNNFKQIQRFHWEYTPILLHTGYVAAPMTIDDDPSDWYSLSTKCDDELQVANILCGQVQLLNENGCLANKTLNNRYGIMQYEKWHGANTKFPFANGKCNDGDESNCYQNAIIKVVQTEAMLRPYCESIGQVHRPAFLYTGGDNPPPNYTSLINWGIENDVIEKCNYIEGSDCDWRGQVASSCFPGRSYYENDSSRDWSNIRGCDGNSNYNLKNNGKTIAKWKWPNYYYYDNLLEWKNVRDKFKHMMEIWFYGWGICKNNTTKACLITDEIDCYKCDEGECIEPELPLIDGFFIDNDFHKNGNDDSRFAILSSIQHSIPNKSIISNNEVIFYINKNNLNSSGNPQIIGFPELFKLY